MDIYSVFGITQDDEVINLYYGKSLDQARIEYDLYNRSKETRGFKEIHLGGTIDKSN
jgi:hypothetical protein